MASGTNARLEGLGAPPPPLALDGNQLAFAVQDATAARPWGWQIEVMDLATGHVLRTIPTQEEIYGFGLSAGTVAYSEGTVDTERGFIYQTRLMVSTPAAATPREIAADAFELSFRDDRLGWVADVEGSQQRSGLERTPRVWTATSASWTPVPVTAAPPKPTTQQQWPAAAAGTVSFDQLDVTDESGGIATLWLWDSETGRAEPVSGSLGAILSSLGGGWLTWAGGVGDAVTVSGMQVASGPSK